MTVDGKPVGMRSDLTGNATTAFEWGFIGGGPLSLPQLSDYFGCGQKARAMCDVFEEDVVAVLLRESWTLTGYSVGIALEQLVGLHTGPHANDVETDGLSGAAFSGATLVVTLHGALSPAEQAMAQSPEGAAEVRDFHCQLF